MVSVIVDPFSDHFGYHILHWIISQSGAWYSKVNENLQYNLRSLETGVSVIDNILTPKDEEEFPHGNQQHIRDVEEINYDRNDNFSSMIYNNSHHIHILNQIVDMNIHFNDRNSIDNQATAMRELPSGKKQLDIYVTTIGSLVFYLSFSHSLSRNKSLIQTSFESSSRLS